MKRLVVVPICLALAVVAWVALGIEWFGYFKYPGGSHALHVSYVPATTTAFEGTFKTVDGKCWKLMVANSIVVRPDRYYLDRPVFAMHYPCNWADGDPVS